MPLTGLLNIIVLISTLTLFLVIVFYIQVAKENPGNDKMKHLANAIQQGAMAFLKREYLFLFAFIAVASIIIAFIPELGIKTSLSFIAGSIFPAIAGYVSMKIATLANTRTANAALEKGQQHAFWLALKSGAVMGFTTSALGILGICLLLYCSENAHDYTYLIGFGLGSCIIGLFGRVGGGIYTKGADVGADLVGKVEAGIPEDDPRNPAVIADNVGDNVGDIAGMGADIFGSYVNAMIATMIISMITFESSLTGICYPLMISVIGLISSLLAFFIMNLFCKKMSPAKVLRIIPFLASFIMIVASSLVTPFFDLSHFFEKSSFSQIPVVTLSVGVIGGILIGLVTEWYTSKSPVEDIAEASKAGHGSNLIQGLSVGMESTLVNGFIICLMIFLSNALMGVYGIGLAAVGMLSCVGITIAIDGYGPIADNAGGIAEMAQLDPKVRDITDHLDALGNTTAAIGKGFSIGSATLTTVALISAFCITLTEAFQGNTSLLAINNPFVMIGLILGGMVTFIFSSLCIKAVGKTAISMVEEVRRQFKTIPGLMEGTADPDYKACVDISTKAALKKMITPGLIVILLPILTPLVFGENSYSVMGGILIGSLVTGLMMALFMSNAGGAWDNAKKYIEAGKLKGHKKGDDVHKAAVTGDTVGDPFKDTSGPALNILIKLIATTSLILLPVLL